MATNPDNESAEVGRIGFKGMAGAHAFLKVDQSPNRSFMQAPGSAVSVLVSTLMRTVQQVPAAHDLFLRYVYCSEQQFAHSAFANARYNMHERLARWLLMCHDRLRDDELAMTHEFLSLMLGVRH